MRWRNAPTTTPSPGSACTSRLRKSSRPPEQEFNLHELAVEDAIHAHQRPKLDVYDDTLFVVLKPARYVDPIEVIDIGEILLFVDRRFVVAVRHGEASKLIEVRKQLEAEPEELRPRAERRALQDHRSRS